MIFVGTNIKIADNSGGLRGKCIRICNVHGRRYGLPGEEVILSVRAVRVGKKVKKGSLYRGVIVRTVKGILRKGGFFVRCGDNAVVLIDKKGYPLGTRVLGPIMLEVKSRGFLGVVSLAAATV